MIAEIITIGDEILIGQIVDTNSTFIAKELDKIGISVHQITSIQDDKAHILSTLKEASERARDVIAKGLDVKTLTSDLYILKITN